MLLSADESARFSLSETSIRAYPCPTSVPRICRSQQMWVSRCGNETARQHTRAQTRTPFFRLKSCAPPFSRFLREGGYLGRDRDDSWNRRGHRTFSNCALGQIFRPQGESRYKQLKGWRIKKNSYQYECTYRLTVRTGTGSDTHHIDGCAVPILHIRSRSSPLRKRCCEHSSFLILTISRATICCQG